MFIDIAIPQNNEKKFIEVAKKLGTEGMIFLYDKFDKNIREKAEKLSSKDFKVYTAFLMKDLKDANKIKKNYDFIFSKGERAHFENKNVDFVFELEDKKARDTTHARTSGLNQILCKLAKEKNIVLCFSFNLALNTKKRDTAMGRMNQNVKLCRKYKVKMLISSSARKPYELRYANDLTSFGVVIGMHPSEAKTAVFNRKV